MTHSSENPWAERFTLLLNRDEIRRRVEVAPRLFTEPELLSPVLATREFKRRLEELFFPSAQCVEILYEWIGLALDHCQSHYYGLREFLETVYREDVPFSAFSFPMCLTGLAGIGKSQLLKALRRLMPPDSSITAEDKTKFRLEGCRILTVQANGTATDMLVALTGQKSEVRTLMRIARKLAYRDGWALLGVDEFQFLTQSDKANARLVQLLMLVGYVGIPVVFISNFSMLHKLLRRNQEDKQRLLTNVWGLFPEPPDSSDWVGMLQRHKCIAPSVFEFNAEADAGAIHQLTGGINRAENRLLEVAFRRAIDSGRAVGLRELEVAYKSREYAGYRADIETLAKLPYSVELQKRHKDLWCPLDIAPRTDSSETFSARRQESVAGAAIEASLSAGERGALIEITTRSLPTQKRNASKIVSIDKKKSLAEQLKEDARWFDENA